MFTALLCKMTKHHVDRHRVWFDQVDYRTSCRLCGTPLLRDRSGWRPFDVRKDGDWNRLPHPREREEP